jgi:glycosyltransferase involved in cell wall biosynthesis
VEIEMFKYIDKDKTSLLTIYSPFNFEKIRALTKETIEKELLKINYMVSICSLSKGKRVDLILKAFSRIKNKDLYLIIIGKGSELEYLFELSCKLDLCSKVKFLGAVENPYKYIYHSKGLILASESEGLPRVLIESLICGIPVISTDCPHGPKEILVENLKNFLIPIIARNEIDIIDDLSIKIDELLINPPEIYEKNLDKFSMQNVIKQWEKLC